MNIGIDVQALFSSVALGAAMAAAPLCSASAKAPVVASGRIGPTVRIPKQLSPKVTLDIHGDSQNVYFTWLMPNGQPANEYFYTSQPSGRYTFQAAPNNGALFGPYTRAGSWTLSGLEVCSYKGCNNYTGSALTTLFPSLNLFVVNPTSDNIPPTVNAGGSIVTPTVAISRHSIFQGYLAMQDNSSGVIYASITFNNGNSGRDTQFVLGGALPNPVVAPTLVPLLTVCDCKRYAAGAYNAVQIELRDAAGNATTVADSATISSLLSGETSISLTD